MSVNNIAVVVHQHKKLKEISDLFFYLKDCVLIGKAGGFFRVSHKKFRAKGETLTSKHIKNCFLMENFLHFRNYTL